MDLGLCCGNKHPNGQDLAILGFASEKSDYIMVHALPSLAFDCTWLAFGLHLMYTLSLVDLRLVCAALHLCLVFPGPYLSLASDLLAIYKKGSLGSAFWQRDS